MKSLRIVFMGTPEFAVGILDAIVKENKYEVVGVITAPDKPAGRGQKIKYSAVKEYALEKELRLLQPTNLKDESFLQELKSLEANLQVVVAFRMLPAVVWKMPELGTFNLHASLLPEYRGAAPINWAIINGETKTGVTTFFIDDKIDTGAMILSKEMPILPDENAGQLHDRLMSLGCEAVVETLEKIANANVVTVLQKDSPEIKTAYKLDRENCKVNFNKGLDAVYNQIRGLAPYPAAYCTFVDQEEQWSVKLYEVEKEIMTHELAIGKVEHTKKEIRVALEGGFLKIKSLQFPGKKRMNAQELLNGMRFTEYLKVE
ncbi:methionyl-tRNA formyltransferase [Flavobacterium columnare NBRC 100251 = ATCC 23463]|uniref:Methionyl-tRNA formyltransferase n=2 Tax=Flavobacterium columnare TaxID=996 RepID=G8X8G7_FLACA|nr:methionyl-tRNA formyltransferase [Flavobacterium columnare]AEW85801.1 methionyl-tRNA formyltransferase [Flavobacterium columnare ATCC 49512]AMO18975.1 methionyl-tRNA formyltransferase [Flavobacterium columnare]APT21527.1 methionyl-tRNA formyltransferase [Flavobacterium columnare]AUX16892.1 methionyl-tRNA formyltransferase [Flavobacterium columnare]MBF6652267.1 methionyl-tRNA formyltransferase [Flavobacterium columnare]